MGTICTYSGEWITLFPFEVTPDKIHIVDIAQSLSKICRFTGHVKQFYSVAQHCVLGSWIAEKMYGQDIAREFFAHDWSEAYLMDFAAPIKRYFPEYSLLENQLMGVICEAFALPFPQSPQVHEIDMILGKKEAMVLMPYSQDPERWNLGDIPNTNIAIQPYGPVESYYMFSDRYRYLFGGESPVAYGEVGTLNVEGLF